MLKMKTKLALIGFLLLLIVFAFIRYEGKNKQIDTLKETVVTTKVENGALKETVQDQKDSAVIVEKVNVEVAKDSDQLREKAKVIQQDTSVKIKRIENEYAWLPETMENQVAKDVARSTVLADGMWSTYCAVKPDTLTCIDPTQ